MSRLAIEIVAGLALLALLGGLWLRHDNHLIDEGIQKQVATDKAAASAQKAWDDAKLKRVGESHATEKRDLQAALDAALAKPPVVRCYSTASSVPAANVPGSPSAAAAVLHEDDAVHPDISRPLLLLAGRADKLSADARELDAATH